MNPEYKNCFQEKDEVRRELLLDLANFCKNYTNEVCNKVIMKFDAIVGSDMIKKMLHELRMREEIELDKFVSDFEFRIGQYLHNPVCDMTYNMHSHPLSHAGSYRDVLYDLLIKE